MCFYSYQGPKVNVCLDSFLHLSPRAASGCRKMLQIQYTAAGNPKERTGELQQLKSDFRVFSWISSFCRIFTWSLFHRSMHLHLSDLLLSHLCVAADNYVGCARLREHYCHASHVWPQLCESASSCSAICPRPGSLIREESCGKVCVSLPDVPLSLQLFVRVGPRQQHRGAGDHYIAAGVWSVHRHCGDRKVESWKRSKKHQADTNTNPLRITVLWF